MKTVFSTGNILRLLVFIAMISAFLLFPNRASAGTMQWTPIDTPSSVNNVVVSPSEVDFIAVAPNGYLFATDVPNSKIYRSHDGGISWQDISNYLVNAGAALPAWNIEVAPDNPNLVAAVTSSGGLPRNVFISFDGGENWQNLNCPAANNICALDISRSYGANDIAVGTRNGAGGGNLLAFKLSGSANWLDQGITGDVISLMFSPNYSGDSTLMAVTSDVNGTFMNLGIRDVMANTTSWGSWGPLEITTASSNTSPKANQIKSADIELPSDFQGQLGTARRIFVSTNDGGSTGTAGVYRIDDVIPYLVTPAAGNTMISSISYFGNNASGKLLAGEVKANASQATVNIWVCLNAAQNCPLANCLIWQKTTKPPTGGANSGNANAQVYWNIDGVKAYCGTSSADLIGGGWPNGYMVGQTFDESAFSYSTDNAATWNQISLIDTEITFLSDVAPSFSADNLYLATVNTNAGFTGFDSIWRGTGYPLFKTWERVMCPLVTSNNIILRLDFTVPGQIYAGFRSMPALYRSIDNGQTWKDVLPNVNITDFAAVNIDGKPNLFILSSNVVRRGAFVGTSWQWQPNMNTTLLTGNSIFVTPTGIILVGDTAGSVAFSQNFSPQFNLLSSLPVGGNVHAIVDTRISNYLVIYAATDNPASDIYTYIVDTSARWLEMSAPKQQYYGLVQLGTFYGAWSSGGNSGVSRTLNPEALGAPFIEWSNLTSSLPAGVAFTREPWALKASAGVYLWAIDNNNYSAATGRLWQFSDTLAAGPMVITPPKYSENLLKAPTPVAPEEGTVIPLDFKTGGTPPVEFKWMHNTEANGYDIWIATDKDFTQPVLQQSVRPPNVMSPSLTLPAKDSPLQPGKTYYWKVRVNRVAGTYQRAEGEWSPTISFSLAAQYIQGTPKQVPVLISPENGAVISGDTINFTWQSIPEATSYQFTLYADAELSEIIIDSKTPAASLRYTEPLEQAKTYYWNVKVIEPYIGEASPAYSFSTGEVQPSANAPVFPEIPVWIYVVGVGVIALAIVIPLIIVNLTRGKKRPY
jgi:hypothetical protein